MLYNVVPIIWKIYTSYINGVNYMKNLHVLHNVVPIM